MAAIRKPLLVLALGAVALAGLAACGDDDSSSGEAGLAENPSKADYIAAADDICQRLYEQRDPLENQAALAAQEGDVEAAASTFENAASITETRFAELRTLPRPEADVQLLEAIYARGDRTAAIAREAAEALRSQDQQTLVQASKRGAANSLKLDKALIEYGFLVCGRGRSAQIG